jgi:hypothetical protein
MQRLRAAERSCRAAIDERIGLDVVRSGRLVAAIGEPLAARYYGVMLASNANTPGYDVEHRRRSARPSTHAPIGAHRGRTLVFGSGAHSAYAGRTRRPSRAS